MKSRNSRPALGCGAPVVTPATCSVVVTASSGTQATGAPSARLIATCALTISMPIAYSPAITHSAGGDRQRRDLLPGEPAQIGEALLLAHVAQHGRDEAPGAGHRVRVPGERALPARVEQVLIALRCSAGRHQIGVVAKRARGKVGGNPAPARIDQRGWQAAGA